MIKVCIYCNRKYPDGNITFHKFPSDKERRKKWLSAMKIPNEDIDKNSYLCSEHFEEETFSCQIVNNVVHRFLYLTAVPSIFKEKISKTAEIDNDSSKNVEMTKDNQSGTIQASQQSKNEEEDCFYYKIVNGVIHRYPREDLKIPDSLLISSTSNETPPIQLEEKLEVDLHTEMIEDIIETNAVHVEKPVKVEYLPEIQIPVEIRNGEIYSKESICDFKSDFFKNYQESKPIFEDIKMDTEEINFEQINKYSNLNGINEVEISSCNPEIVEVNQQEISQQEVDQQDVYQQNIDQEEETSLSEDFNMDTEEFEKNMDDLSDGSEDEETEITNKTNVKKTGTSNKDSEKETPVEKYGDKSMKTLLYKCLENKDNYDLDRKLKRYTKQKLTQLLKTALNYIECLEDKLTITTEKNSQYEMQILELENLLQSISDTETSKNTPK